MNARLEPRTDGPAAYGTDDAKWQAVVEKDRNADGEFYYLRGGPSCPARAQAIIQAQYL
jgi:methylphosphotriester-DNA--protein-cysteine methyltransferase